MIAKATMLLFFFAVSKQVAFVDLSSTPKTVESGPQTISVRGGGVLCGNTPHPLPGTPPVSLKLNQIISWREGALLKNVVEVVLTNKGQSPISVPIGDDPVPLLEVHEQDRRHYLFSVTLSKSGRLLATAESASNSGHLEFTVTVPPGDTITFWLPAGYRPADAQEWSREDAPQEISVSVELYRKVLENGKDWEEAIGEKVVSENTLPLS